MRRTLTLFSIFLLVSPVTAQIAAGGSYTLVRSVIAGGGSDSSGGSLSITGTVGQSAAGQISFANVHTLRGGFWQSTPLAPTAGRVRIIGRVTTLGRGVPNVMVKLSDHTGLVFAAVTNTFGYFRFNEVVAGIDYIVAVQHRRYVFADNPRLLNVTEDLYGVDFIEVRRN